ncbi:30S ribosomal protein S20 [compost metagenome]
MRSAIRSVVKAIATGDKTAAEKAFKAAVPAIDRSVAKGLMAKNKAARHKSRLNTHVKGL